MGKKIIYLVPVLILILVVVSLLVTPGFMVEEFTITYPFDGTLFPPDFASPTFRWNDGASGANHWKVGIGLPGLKNAMEYETAAMEWKPARPLWESIKERTLEQTATVAITGYRTILGVKKTVSRQAVTFSTSPDEVGAPIFFRSVTLPFEFALKNMESIKWCLGDVSSEEPPRVVLENMPMCGNCHSFSANGDVLGMDVDYANDKGSYIITNIAEDVMLTADKVISWSDYRREDGEMTFGLLSQISPSGRYAVSTVKDRSVFVPKNDLYYSQLFFPLKGILSYYDVAAKTFHALPGADDRKYVQSNPSWSPDGRYIIFAKNEADDLIGVGKQAVLTQDQCQDYLTGGKKFRFSLYRIPFNDGKGGTAEPIPGASHNGMSNYFAKYSPDGKWIVFCRADSFMLLQPDSRLYIMPAEGGEPREMNCNTNRMNSWHSWSPNGRWLVFTSKCFTPYTQLLLTHIDENGNDSPPVVLENFTPPDRAVNIPEFANISPDGIKKMHEQFIDDYTYFRSGYSFADYFEDYDRAEQEYRKALEINPDNVDARLRLAKIYLEEESFADAENELLAALKIRPDDTYANNQLGGIYKVRKEYDRAIEKFTFVLQREPNNFFAHHNLGYIYLERKEYDLAEQVFLDMQKIAMEYENDQTDAVTSATELENRVRVHANLGNLYMAKSEFPKAEKEFQTVVQMTPDNFRGHLSLGTVYTRMGKTSLAIQELEFALNLNPSYPGLREKVAKLKSMTMRH